MARVRMFSEMKSGVDQLLPGHEIAGVFGQTHQHLHHFQFD
jgi:hypothetical protein